MRASAAGLGLLANVSVTLLDLREQAVGLRAAVEKFGCEFQPFAAGQRVVFPRGKVVEHRYADAFFERGDVFGASRGKEYSIGREDQQFFGIELPAVEKFSQILPFGQD